MLTDGKAGDLSQCLGLAEALGLDASIRRVAPRRVFALLAPWGPIDPAEAPGRPSSPLAPPFPDLLIASGRRAVPYVRHLRRASGGCCFTVILKDPRSGPGTADLIWVPEHDRLHGPNVIRTLTGPHRVSAARLAAARAQPDPRLAALPEPRLLALIGGDSRHHRYTEADVARLSTDLHAAAAEAGSIVMSLSRRTPSRLAEVARALAAEMPHALLHESGEADPSYLAMLALADAIVVTADSVNMMGEAVATGSPVLAFEPSGGHVRLRTYLEALIAYGAVRRFTGRLEAFAYQPLDTTPVIAAAVREGLLRHRAASLASRAEA